jgi:hypothetical protein
MIPLTGTYINMRVNLFHNLIAKILRGNHCKEILADSSSFTVLPKGNTRMIVET